MFGPGSSHSARVTAWAHLAKILGLFVERKVISGDANSPIVFDMRFGDGLRTVNGDPAPVPQVIENQAPGVGSD